MRQSSVTNVICTLVEASGLVIVIVLGAWYLSSAPRAAVAPAPPASLLEVGHGAGLAFFARERVSRRPVSS